MAHHLNKARRKGMAAVEAALVLPIVLLVVFAGIQYGLLFLKAELLTNAARQGARKAIVADATLAEVTAAVDELLSTANISGYSTSVTPGVEVEKGTTVTVTVAAPTSGLGFSGMSFVPMPSTLTASASMAKEAP